MTLSDYAVKIERFPLHGRPLPPLNFDRLPPPEQFREMELAYRPEELISETEGRQVLCRCLLFAFAIPDLTSLALWLSSQWTPLNEQLRRVEGLPLLSGIIGALAGTALVVAYAFLLSRTAQLTVAATLLPGAATVFLIAHHAPTALVLRILLGLLLVWVLSPLRALFTRHYADWLLADPRLSTEQRKTNIVPASRQYLIPTLLIILAVLAAGTPKLPWLLCLFVFLLPGATAFAESRRFLPVFFLPNPEMPAPGLWTPTTSALRRLPVLATLASLCYGAAALALHDAFGPASTFLVPLLGNLLLIGIMRPVLSALPKMRAAAAQLAEANPERTWWECQVERLRGSHHVAANPTPRAEEKTISEAQHLFLGFEPSHHQPILLSQKLLTEHCYIVGKTGSGKTSIGMTQFLNQLARGHRTKDGWTDPSPIVILDLKGDDLLFHTAKAEAERRGQDFRFFTLGGKKASHRFNPFRGFDSELRSLPQLVQLILDSLSLNHGTGYGKSYYSQTSRFMLSRALQRQPAPQSFNDLYKTLEFMRKEDPRTYKDAFELLCTIEVLTHYWQLLTSKDESVANQNGIIHMANVLEKRQVVYFYLSAALESISVREVAKLALFNLHSALLDRLAQKASPRQVYLFIDEFQKAAGENFQTIIQQGRSAGMSVILANQSLSDLKGDIDLRPTIQTNTGTKLYFSVTDPEEIKTLSLLSGQVVQAVGPDGEESIAPSLGVNEILSMSDHRRQFLLHVASGRGYTQFGSRPVVVETEWPMSEATAERLEKHTPWPDEPQPPHGPIAAQASEEPEKIEADLKAKRRAEHAKAIQEMED